MDSQYYIQKIRAINEEKYRKTNKRPLMYIRTFGCQMNVRDSEKLTGTLEAMGFLPTDDEKEAGLVLYNTCCVRENAENKVFGNLGYLKFQKQQKPDLIIVLCGCMTQLDTTISEIKKHHSHVNVVFGTMNRSRFPYLLYKYLETGVSVIDTDVADDDDDDLTDPCRLISREYAHKAGVNVMYGCDNFCSYCIVPYVRGRERSRPAEAVLTEVQALAADGVKEVMLLGQNVNAYGAGLNEKTDFAQLLRRVNEVSGLERIRFMTSHPKDLSDELIAAVRDCDKVCKHVHLPFQSGSTRVLGEMNRQYTKEDYLALLNRIQAAIPGIALSTDVIVGFPGETEADFQDTLAVIRQARFSGVFTFLYSKRTGTPAAEREDQIPLKMAEDRFKRLLAVVNPILAERNEGLIGKVLPVMADIGVPRKNGALTGRADDNTLVHFYGSDNIKPGDLVHVKIDEYKTFYVGGTDVRLL